MFKCHRHTVLVIVVLALIGTGEAPYYPAKAEQKQAQTEGTNTDYSVGFPSATADKEIQPPKESPPCGNASYNKNNDLCAQWKAADAARDAADWAWWQLVLSALGVFGIGATLWFNFRALILAEKASIETGNALAIAERNAVAAAEQVEVSVETAKRQLRPYVFVSLDQSEVVLLATKTIINEVSDTQVEAPDHVQFKVKFTNFGQTPARQVVCYIRSYITEFGAKPNFHLGTGSASEYPHGNVPQGDGFSVTTECRKASEEWKFMASGRSVFVVQGRVLYVDDAEGEYQTNFTLTCALKFTDIGTIIFCDDGNDAT